MNTKKIIFSLTLVLLLAISCKKEVKKVELPVKKTEVALAISGMTCEIGCAKTIQSKLSKKEGVLAAKVVFADSIATIEYDANKTSEKELVAYVDGIAGGKLYKASVNKNTTHSCPENCKMKCNQKTATKTACKKDCKMASCSKKNT